MIDVWTLGTIKEFISNDAQRRFERQGELCDPTVLKALVALPTRSPLNPRIARTLGILLARPEQPLAKTEIIPSLNYFHHRSADYIDFFCGGYGTEWNLGPYDDGEIVLERGPGETRWFFSQRAFTEFINDIETESTWKYRGGPELLLLVSEIDASTGRIDLDYSRLIEIDLQRATTDKAIVSVHHLFEDIFRGARKYGLERLSDVGSAKVFLKEVGDNLLGKLPLGTGKAAKKASYFLVRDRSP